MKSEPVVVGATLIAFVQALLVVVVTFGVDITAEQTAALMGLVTSAVAIGQAMLTRSQVTPMFRADARVEAAKKQAATKPRPKRARS